MTEREEAKSAVSYVEREEYYHLERTATPFRRYSIGSTYRFGKDKNRYIARFDIDSLYCNSANELYELRDSTGKLYKMPDFAQEMLAYFIHQDTNEDAEQQAPLIRRVKTYLETWNASTKVNKTHETSELHELGGYYELLRELIFEEVRRGCYSNHPSRHKCLWLIPPESAALKWWRKRGFDQLTWDRVLKVKATGKIHRAKEGHIAPTSRNRLDEYAEAWMYWSGSLLNKSLNGVEILFEGDATMIEVVDETSIT